jgi:hypothetical protein
MATGSHPLASPLPLRVPTLPGEADGEANTPYSAKWDFVSSDVIVDWGRGVVWRQCLDLGALVTCCSDGPTLMGFLQRRRQDLPYPSACVAPRQLSLAVCKSLIQEHVQLPTLAAVFTVLCSSYHDAVTSGLTDKGRAQWNLLLPRRCFAFSN